MIISCLLILLLILTHLLPRQMRKKVTSRIKRGFVWIRNKFRETVKTLYKRFS